METPEKKINIEVPYEVSVVHNFFAWAITYKEKDSINLGEVSRLVAKWEESEVFRSIKGRLETSVKLLRDLTDLQNGAPLEQHRKEWEETMRQVYDFLNKAESHPEQLKEKTKEVTPAQFWARESKNYETYLGIYTNTITLKEDDLYSLMEEYSKTVKG